MLGLAFIQRRRLPTKGVRDFRFRDYLNFCCLLAALATIEYIEKENLADHAKELGHYSLKGMREMMDRHPMIGDLRGLGLFLGIELVKDRTTRERATDEAEAVMYSALSKGLSFKLTMGNIITLTTALTIKREEMDKALDIIDECLTEVEKAS